MREALEQNNKVAVGRVVMHEKEHLIALRSYEGAILMTTLHYADEVRTPRDFPELKKPPEVEKEELELAGQLIKIMKKPFNFKEEVSATLQPPIQKSKPSRNESERKRQS